MLRSTEHCNVRLEKWEFFLTFFIITFYLHKCVLARETKDGMRYGQQAMYRL